MICISLLLIVHCETVSFMAQKSHAVQRYTELQQKIQPDLHRRRHQSQFRLPVGHR